MCINEVADFKIKLNKKGEGRSWKIFVKENGLLYSMIYRSKPFVLNQWLQEKEYRPDVVDAETAGFYIFKNRQKSWGKGRENEIVKKVYFRTILEKGKWAGVETIRVKEIFIPNQ